MKKKYKLFKMRRYGFAMAFLMNCVLACQSKTETASLDADPNIKTGKSASKKAIVIPSNGVPTELPETDELLRPSEEKKIADELERPISRGEDIWKIIDEPNAKKELNPKYNAINMPFPENTQLFSIQSFLSDYKDLYQSYMPLMKEYRMLFVAINSPQSNRKDVAAIKLRLRESFDRAHWTFLAGLLETNEFLVNRATGSLQVDQEKNFVARIKVLSFLAAELSRSSGEQKYNEFLKEAYIDMSKKYFNRRLRNQENEAGSVK